MPSDRRFSEREIREVFERAAAQQQAAAQEADGLTLAEMQEVAVSAGLDPAFVARAAQAVALGEPEQGRTATGPIPTGVYRTELLPGPPTDALWAALLSDLRHTFNAEGKARDDGHMREWRNGNLRATLEPAGAGSRLSLRTRRDGQAGVVVNLGVLMTVGLLAVAISLIGYGDAETAIGWLWMVFGGAAGMTGAWVGQRSWVTAREGQMEDVATRARDRSADALPPLASPLESPAVGGQILDLDALGDAPDAETRRDPRRSRA